MIKFHLKDVAIAGFTKDDASEGDPVHLIEREALTSDHPRFYLYVSQMSDIYLRQIGGPVGPVSKFLAVHHDDDWVDVYINDFREAITYTFNRDLEAGQPFFKNDISDVKKVTFPDIEIVASDAIFYCSKINWKFGVFFDYTRKLDVDAMAREIGGLHKRLECEDYLIRAEAAIEFAGAHSEVVRPVVVTEGKTDWRHLKNAAAKLRIAPAFELAELDDRGGDDDALKMCEHYAKLPNPTKRVFMFDRDNARLIKQLEAKTRPHEDFQRWGNNVFSFMIPIPPHRAGREHVSIEFYYTDEEICTRDSSGRRLHFSNELKKEIVPGSPVRRIVIDAVAAIGSTKRIDADDAATIFDAAGNQVGLSKTAFAENILNETPGFDSFGVDSFQEIFDVIKKISEIE